MNDFGLYIHWPFCAKKCPYCDFNSHVRVAPDEEAWIAGVIAELHLVAAMQGQRRPAVNTVYFGGGTPSLMHPASIGRIIEEAAKLWPCPKDMEITLEANPASADAERFAGYADAGVNRLSLGVQSFRDETLKFLGRLHDVAQAKAALAHAQAIFSRVSFDLIYAVPGQSIEAWRQELAEALAYGTEHLSAYQLTIEPITPFATMQKRGLFRMPDDEAAVALYETTQEMTAAAGLPAYEISNYARPGAESRHNLLYWRYGDYAGAGPGAHGRLDLYGRRFAFLCERLPERWKEKIEQKGHGFANVDEIDRREGAREHLLMNLRLTEGLDIAAYQTRWATTLPADKLANLTELGLIATTDGRLRATLPGRLVLNRIIAELAD